MRVYPISANENIKNKRKEFEDEAKRVKMDEMEFNDPVDTQLKGILVISNYVLKEFE